MWTNKIVTACALMLAVSISQQIEMGSVDGLSTGQLYFGTPIQGSGKSNNFAFDTTQSYTSVVSTFFNQTASTTAVNKINGTQTLTWVAPSSTSYTIDGTLVEDTVCLQNTTTSCVDQFTFFLIQSASWDVKGLDGIIGLAPGTSSLPSYVEEQYSNGLINSPAVSFAFDAGRNYAIWGAPESTQYNSQLYQFNNTSTDKWTLSIGSIHYGNTTINSTAESALLATAMDGIALSASDYQTFYSQFNNSTNSSFTCDGPNCTSTQQCGNFSSLPSLTFALDDNYFSIPPAGYLDPSADSLGCALSVYPSNQTVFGQGFLKSFFVNLNYSPDTPLPIGIALNKNYAVNAAISSVEQEQVPIDSGMSTGSIVLIIIAACALLAIVIYCIHKKKQESDDRYQAA